MKTYNFVSPEPLFAEIRLSLASYFNSGILDDLQFPIWVQQATGKLGIGANYKLEKICLEICNYEACLPEDLFSVREVWACANFTQVVPDTSSFYYQKDCRIERSAIGACDPCFDTPPPVEEFALMACGGEEFKVTHKVTGTTLYKFTTTYLLKPSNNALSCCSSDCANYRSKSYDTFDIINGKILTSFPEGKLYITYYSNSPLEECKIIDNFRVKEYIAAYLMYKCFEMLCNSITDETFNQLFTKLQYYKTECDEALILAQIEMKKQNVYDIAQSIKNTKNRYNKYKIR